MISLIIDSYFYSYLFLIYSKGVTQLLNKKDARSFDENDESMFEVISLCLVYHYN